jgi:hypothetical protein
VPLSPDKIADLHAKELELLQAVIARMANYGATLKNYCITLTTAVAGFAVTQHRPLASLLALLPIVVCGALDAQYLRNERRFRGLYHKMRGENWETLPSFNISLAAAPPHSYLEALRSWSIMYFYTPLSIAIIVITLMTGRAYGLF